ncbi:MAG: ATP-dependent helicase [Methylacidiphilales bacterium]|nr:ATP-dependent helicase [Candidatus Methylacidiphilales bacterium]
MSLASEMKTLEQYWSQLGFRPNPEQAQAILYEGRSPLFLSAAPGSGKTRVLLWRTFNLLVNRGVKPSEILLCTFTKKAARELVEGLKLLLSSYQKVSGESIDIAGMFVGTIHSNCYRILGSRDFDVARERKKVPMVLDEFKQYLYVHNYTFMNTMLEFAGINSTSIETFIPEVNEYLGKTNSTSRHKFTDNVISLFNRLSEELFDTSLDCVGDDLDSRLLRMYQYYVNSLTENSYSDLSLMQKDALHRVVRLKISPFAHVIIDEYQDTNHVQEQLFFALTKAGSHICVVGDDDQSLYRFRGATVTNFTQFDLRCQHYLAMRPTMISLNTNYRSLPEIVTTYQNFMESQDWGKNSLFHIKKELQVHRKNRNSDAILSVCVTDEQDSKEDAIANLVLLIKKLKSEGKVSDYNQIAILFTYLQGNKFLSELRSALAESGLPSYCPRASLMLEQDVSKVMVGLLCTIYGYDKKIFGELKTWIPAVLQRAHEEMREDTELKKYCKNLSKEIALQCVWLEEITERIAQCAIDRDQKISEENLAALLKGVSAKNQIAKSLRQNKLMEHGMSRYPLRRMLSYASTSDYGFLDIFYKLLSFSYFSKQLSIDKNSSNEDVTVMHTLSAISDFLNTLVEMGYAKQLNSALEFANLTQSKEDEDDDDNPSFSILPKFYHKGFSSYLRAMYLQEIKEHEDSDDPFPKGRVPIITIHQSKGLEFPVVILGNLYKKKNEVNVLESFIRKVIPRYSTMPPEQLEPIAKLTLYDTARLFYVAMSRAKNTLIMLRFKKQNRIDSLKTITDSLNSISLSEVYQCVHEEKKQTVSLGKSYSLSADINSYQQCPRKYMFYRMFGFTPSREIGPQYGALVFKTINDMHNYELLQKQNKSS